MLEDYEDALSDKTSRWVVVLQREFWDENLAEAELELSQPMDLESAIEYAELVIETLWAVQTTIINYQTGQMYTQIPN